MCIFLKKCIRKAGKKKEGSTVGKKECSKYNNKGEGEEGRREGK